MGREWHLCPGAELLGKEEEGRCLNQTMASSATSLDQFVRTWVDFGEQKGPVSDTD